MEKLFASGGYVTFFDFVSGFFCLTVPRNFVGKPFSVSILSGAEEVWIGDGVKYHDFPSKIFVSVAKNFVREPFRVSLISGMEKVFASEGYITIFDFLSIFLSHSAEKFRR